MSDFTKVIRPAYMEHHPVFCKIEFKGGKLSITGVVGPKRNGDAHGSCGQVVMTFKEYDDRGYTSVNDLCEQDGFTKESLKKFFDIWHRWHLNDLTAGSPDQEAYLRNHPVKFKYPESHYETACKMLKEAGLNPDPNYIHNGKPYSYGHAWLREEVPTEVIDFLRSLPETPVTPAWV